MIIRRIEVRNFRKLTNPVVIEDLGPGLSVIAGENEEGKSTLVDSIRTAFFVKHNITGELAAGLQPFNSNVRPEVRIEFELGGECYRLFKAFCQQPEVELVTPTGRLTGPAAEEELSRLLRFSLPKRIRQDGQREHEGVFGMFWVEQGKSISLEPNTAGRNSILEALQREVGDVLGGKRGRRLIADVSRGREELLTSTGKPRGAFAQATHAIVDIETQLRHVEEQLESHNRNTEELQRLRARMNRFQQERVLELAGERVQTSQAASEAVGQFEGMVSDANIALQGARGRHELAAERAGQRAKSVENVHAAEIIQEKLVKSAETEQARVGILRGMLQADQGALAETEAELSSAVKELTRAETENRLSTARAELTRLEQDRDAALAATHEREVALRTAAAIVVDKSGLAELRRLEDAVTRARARLESVATHIRVSVSPGAEVVLDGQPISGELERTLTRAAVIQVRDHIQLSIFPGSGVSDPHEQLATASRALNETLQGICATSLADAEDQLERRGAAMSQAQTSGKLISVHAPNGLEELVNQIAAVANEVQRLEEIVGTERREERADETRRALALLRQCRNEAQARVDAARSKAEETRCQLIEAVNSETAANARLEHQKDLCVEYRQRLESEQRATSDAELDTNVLQTTRDVHAAEVTLAAARRRLAEANPEAVAQERRMAEAAYRQIEVEFSNLHERILRLEAELCVSGGLGLGERREELQSHLAVAQAEAARIERQARTLDLLCRVLLEAESAAKEQFLRPVTERVQAYLKMLLPETELAFDEEIRIVGLRRGTTVEPFHMLSIGTREQLAVLTRLAFADLLREHGHPAAVLLDDAIVFADCERFERMLHILDKAAQNVQVVVLTCREQDYRASGAPIIRLADCQVRMAAAN